MNLYLYNFCMIALNAGEKENGEPIVTSFDFSMNDKKYIFAWEYLAGTWRFEEKDLRPENFYLTITEWANLNKEMCIETINYIFKKEF